MASSNTSIMYELAIFVPGRVRLLPGGLYTTDLPGLPLPLVGTLHWSPPGPVFHDLCARLHGLHGFKTRRNFNGGEFYSLCHSLVLTSLFLSESIDAKPFNPGNIAISGINFREFQVMFVALNIKDASLHCLPCSQLVHHTKPAHFE